MKKPIPNQPVFNPANRTLDFSNTPNFDLRRVAGVSNVKTGDFLYSPIWPALRPAAVVGSVVTLSFDTTAMSSTDPLFIPYDDGINDLPPNAATASKQDQQTTVLQNLLNAIKAQRVETIWTDDSGARYIRLDSGGVISWSDVAGNPSSAPGTGSRPDFDSGTVVAQSNYRATASGTGFSAQDYLNHIVVVDGDAGDLVSNFWLNVTAGTKIAAPNASAITPLSPLPDGAATAVKQDTGNTSLALVAAGIGAPGDDDPGSDAADGSVIARMARLLASTTGLATLLAAVRDRLPSTLVGGRLSVDGSGVTQPVSAAALPLPAGAATSALQGTGNTSLSNLYTSLGTSADAAASSDTVAGSLIAKITRLLATATTIANNALAATAVTDTPVTLVAATNQAPVAANTARRLLIITNTGANPLAYRFGTAATAAVGHILSPGQTVTFDARVPTAALNMISTAGTTALVTTG